MPCVGNCLLGLFVCHPSHHFCLLGFCVIPFETKVLNQGVSIGLTPCV